MTDRMKLSRRGFGGLAVGAAAATLFRPGIVRAQTAVTLAVPNPSALTWMPYWVAVGEGYFEEEGLGVTIQPVDTALSAVQAVATGQAFMTYASSVILNRHQLLRKNFVLKQHAQSNQYLL